MSKSFLKMLSPFSRPEGMSSSSGNSVSHQYFQSFSRETTWTNKIDHCSISSSYHFKKILERLQVTELHQIEPNDVKHPTKWFWLQNYQNCTFPVLASVYHLNRVEVKCRSSLEQREELLVIDVAVVEVNFQGKKEGEQKLVLLIESSTGVSPDRLG